MLEDFLRILIVAVLAVAIVVGAVYGIATSVIWTEGERRCTQFGYDVYMYKSQAYCRVDEKLVLSSDVVEGHIIQVE